MLHTNFVVFVFVTSLSHGLCGDVNAFSLVPAATVATHYNQPTF